MRFLSAVLTAFLLVAAPAAMAAPAPASSEQIKPDASTLAVRYIAWRGGAAFDKLQSFHVVADIEAEGLKGETREWRERSGRTRDEWDLGPLKGESVRTLTAGWNKGEALVRSVGHFTLQDNRREMAVEFGDALRGKSGATVERMPDETFDGRNFAVLRIRFGDSDSYDLILDPATGALHGYRFTQDSTAGFTRLSDWRFVDGVRFPFKRESYRPNGKLDVTVNVRSIDTNKKFADSLFAKPVGERTLTFAPGTHSTGPIRYNPFTGTRIYIPAKVNGQDVEVLLDSGADGTVLDKAFAESVGRKQIGSGVARGSGGEQEQGYARDITISIGNMSLDLPSVGVTDLASVGQRIGIPLPVVLGQDVFLQSIVDIDPASLTINFLDPATFTPPPGAIELPLEPLGSLRVVPVSVEGLPDAPMIFDLGNGGYMSLTPAYWQKHNLLAGRKSSTRSSGAVGGEHINRVATLRTIRFAGITFHDVPAEFTAPNIETNSDREAGKIGMPLLKRFRMLIDMQNSRLFLIPIASRLDAPFDRDRSGIRAVHEGKKLIVRHVSTGSPAEAAGWKEGDTIVAIDGQPIGPGFDSSQLSLWARAPEGTVVTLTMADGSTRKLTLADYF
jgi:hypothetical protein